MTITVPLSLLQKAGTLAIAVTNPPPGGGTSAVANLTIANPIPALTGVSPASIAASQSAPVLTVTGTSFVPGAVISLGGLALATTFVSATQLTAALSSLPALPLGNITVTITNPTPGGGSSNTMSIQRN
jgi:hypothetical protein